MIKLTTNKKLYQGLASQDIFEDRLVLFLIHFAFFLNVYNKKEDKKILQEIYDLNFRHLELSIREIGYGDQSINKKMKDYVNLLHSMISEIHFWDNLEKKTKIKKISIFFQDLKKIDYLVEYFEDFNQKLAKKKFEFFLEQCN